MIYVQSLSLEGCFQYVVLILLSVLKIAILMLASECPCPTLKIGSPKNETMVNLKSASFFVIMHLHQWCQTDPVKGRCGCRFSFQPSKNTPDPNQVCSCLVGMKTCSHSDPLLDQFDTTDLHKGLTHIQSQIKPWLLFDESFTLRILCGNYMFLVQKPFQAYLITCWN